MVVCLSRSVCLAWMASYVETPVGHGLSITGTTSTSTRFPCRRSLCLPCQSCLSLRRCHRRPYPRICLQRGCSGQRDGLWSRITTSGQSMDMLHSLLLFSSTRIMLPATRPFLSFIRPGPPDLLLWPFCIDGPGSFGRWKAEGEMEFCTARLTDRWRMACLCFASMGDSSQG